ncbi:lysozyme [Streptomyces sp. MST-110588]|uniref:lysozyme n=1 Tax=Streptomyces sp. MST-110588 TaxID=2833628 RepID=UPI001F5D5838|nr:lysozyme [Streptomyces sp. MST-110588]UNO42776.1 lysozyme [Streptomyces sp. MST-110588]
MARDHQPLHSPDHSATATHPSYLDRRDRRDRRGRRALLAVSVVAATLGTTTLAAAPTALAAPIRLRGHDVSAHQKNVDWHSARAKGARFVYVKATEALSYRNPYFRQQYNGSRRAGLVRGAYHFAVPTASSGTAQARYFLRNGGRWSADGWTLPPALDIEHNPYNRKNPCFGMSRAALVRWIGAFSREVRRGTGRTPVIYTTARWWNGCTGGNRSFGRTHPLWLADWHGAAGPLPAGWSFVSFRQYADDGALPGDQNRWNGSVAQLKRFARG